MWSHRSNRQVERLVLTFSEILKSRDTASELAGTPPAVMHDLRFGPQHVRLMIAVVKNGRFSVFREDRRVELINIRINLENISFLLRYI
jgi:hypothetical protein